MTVGRPIGGVRPSTEVSTITRIDDLTDKVDSKFHLVHLAAQRAREINGYYAQLGEGLGTHVPPLVSVPSNKPLSIALEEIAQAKIEAIDVSELETPDEGLQFLEGGAEGDVDGDEPA